MSKRSMPLLLAIAIMMIVAIGCHKQPEPIVITPDIEKNHLDRNHIFGLVKEIESQSFLVRDDSLSLADTSHLAEVLAHRQPTLTSTQRYTSDGFLTRYVKYNAETLDTVVRRYTYNKKAQIVEWTETTSNDTIRTTGKYLYDRNGFITGEQVFQGDSVVMAFAHTTDGIGNIIRTAQSFGDYTTRTETKYNENGLVSKIIEYEPNGKVFKTVTIEYDNYGDEVNRCAYKSGNQMIEYTYNLYSQEGRQLKTIYEDKIHNVKQYTYYFDFDDQNNWQTEVKAVDNKIYSIRKRTITYYQQ